MANKVNSDKTLDNGIEKYDEAFQNDEILTAEHLNFAASNINAIIDALTWEEA